uniref:Nucleoporin seh1 n=1 Tax=Lygus hesperus TaxID=30085 RepID=A0A0A9Z7Y2_LYGHE
MDVAFAPPHVGFFVAAASLDGSTRIYECNQASDASGNWSLNRSIDSHPARENLSVHWTDSPYLATLLAIAVHSTVEVYHFVLEKNTFVPYVRMDLRHGQIWCARWAPNVGRSYHLLATLCHDGYLCIWRIFDANTKSNVGPETLGVGEACATNAVLAGFRASLEAPLTGAAVEGSGAGDTGAQYQLVYEFQITKYQNHLRCAWNSMGTQILTTCGDGCVFEHSLDNSNRWVTIFLGNLFDDAHSTHFPLIPYTQQQLQQQH